MGPYDLIFDTMKPSFSVIGFASLTAVILREQGDRRIPVKVKIIQPPGLSRAIENESWELMGKHQKIKLASIKTAVLQRKKT